jgi:hypothetical protein
LLPPDLPALLGELRDLTTRYKAGTQDSFWAFRDLATKLLHLTVVSATAYPRLTRGLAKQDEFILGGRDGPTDPLPLNDGRLLRVSVSLYREEDESGSRIKVRTSSFQYQKDPEGKRWIFRYDYIRRPPEPQPAAHVQIRGKLSERCLPRNKPLHRVHFPTMRVSLEAVIRLLVDEFNVRCNEPQTVWRPALQQTEREFLEIAHRPLGT